MKKLVMSIAAIALASSLYAATAAWGFKNDGAKTYANAMAYMVDNAQLSTILAALDAGGSDIASTMEGYALSSKALSSKGAGTSSYGSATSGDNYNWIVVMSGGSAIADGMTYYSTDAISYATLNAAGAIAEGAATPSTYYIVDDTVNRLTGTSGTIGSGGGSSVPEPTSGLLVLLGVAGLALRRRRA